MIICVGGNRLDGCGGAEQPRFGGERGGEQLRAAQPRIQTGRAAGEHRRKAATVTPVDEPFDLPFRQQRELDEADAFIVADHRDLLAVKIAAVNHHAAVGKNQRIVRAGV